MNDPATTLTWLALAALAIAATAGVALYAFAPGRFVAGLLRVARRLCGMSTRTVRVGDADWPYLDGGPRDAPAVVLVHGFCGEKDNWTLYARAFRRRYRVIVPDLPGFGGNVRDPAGRYGVDDQAAYLRQFLGALGIERCHLAGNSMGGFIGLKVALAHPGLLASLVIVDGAGVRGESASDLERAVDRGENPFDVQSMQEVDAFIAMVMHKRPWLPHVYKRAALAQYTRNRPLLTRLFADLAEEMQQRPLNDRLGDVAVPTLILWGRHDRLIHVSCAHVMADGIPNSEITVFEDLGHVPMMEDPAPVARRHLAFLDEVEARAAAVA